MLTSYKKKSDILKKKKAKIESSAEYLYGLIHARYVLTSAGLNAVLEKFYNAEYGRCPRVFCKDQPVAKP